MATKLLSPSDAWATQTDFWWDFLTGGDGVRMKSLIAVFNEEHKGNIEIQATTLDGGTPYCSKVQTSAAIGQGPDVMNYQLSRLPRAVKDGTLSEITADDMAAAGLTAADYSPLSMAAAKVDDKQYAVPFDSHPISLYYYKDIRP